ncbi:LysR family transcriptional regulator ArgP [Streptomyces corynorhini]|uniref:HTH-type transcriptional regulator LysG n=1 Tax=Streptomyces corynorhini TaxID=2282652 RepID=A0A370AYZ4_9ACTN|nr:LysR family transcriptional regulator ArgP [Streptomyces corynorhini]RDG34800.1 LysR family transcriptional regulator ArgP [Streptomyces corynorhini]
MMSELPHDLVRTLLAVCDEGTFDAAAGVLHVTPSAVSQRVKALEQRTGRVLVTRTKPVRPTASGQVVVRYARQLARLEGDARAALGMDDAGEHTRLSVAVNADSLATWFLPALATLAHDARLCFDLRREDEAHTAELLREGEVMAAVTSSPDAVAGCSVRRLGSMSYLPVAAPEFAARWLTGDTVERLLPRAPLICFDRRDEFQDVFVRELTGASGENSGSGGSGGSERNGGNGTSAGSGGSGASALRHRIPSSEGFADAVTAGLGWGLVPRSQAEPRLRSGALVGIAPGRILRVPLYWQQWRLDSPALAAVSEAVAAAAARSLE